MHDDMRERSQLFIGGRWTAPHSTAPAIEVTDASTGGHLGSIPAGDAADVDRAVAAAQAAADEWRQTDPAERAAALEAVREQLASRLDDIAELISLEVGTPSNISIPARRLSE